jgi:hypothetical protein
MGAPGFIERARNHDVFKDEIALDVRRWGYEVIENGRENLIRGNNLGDGPGALWLRMRPDLAVIVNSDCVFLDPKLSNAIERSPYEHYMAMAHHDIPVYVVARKNRDTRFCDIESLQTRAEHKVWPVVEGWITPRAHPDYEYYKRVEFPLTPGKKYYGSGTPFKYFDFNSMVEWGPMWFQWLTNNGGG